MGRNNSIIGIDIQTSLNKRRREGGLVAVEEERELSFESFLEISIFLKRQIDIATQRYLDTTGNRKN